MIITITSRRHGIKQLIIDDEDFVKLTNLNICLSMESRTSKSELFYAVAHSRPRQKGMALIRVHRLILGAKPGELVDHINGDTLDNRKVNLRVTSHAVNMQNTRKRANASSSHKGVDFQKKYGLWRARLYIEGKQHNLGAFLTEIEAAKAYNAALEKYGSSSPRNKVS